MNFILDTFHIVESSNMQPFLSGFFHSLNLMFSKFIHVTACVCTHPFYMGEWYSIVWIYHIIYSFNIWVVSISYNIKNGIVNIRTFLCGYVFSFLRYILRNRIAGIHVNFIFNSLRNCQAFSEVDKPFQILTNNVLGLRFLHIFVNTFYCPLDYPF